jgi:subtilisin family serine protease
MNNSPIKRTAHAAFLIVASFAGGAYAVDIAPSVAAQATQEGSADALIVFDDGALPAVDASLDYRARRSAIVDALQSRAATHQRSLRAWLDSQGIAHDDFWIVDAIHARLTRSHLNVLAARSEAMHVEANPIVQRVLPEPELLPQPQQAEAPSIGWGVMKINAPSVWAAGFTGQGVVIGGEDTGYQWDHPILKPQYRGWNGATANHDYNWHDAIHDAQMNNPCGSNSPAPCDDDQHGTHTAGTFAGDDGAAASPRHQYGVAPGVKWIGCRNMDEGAGTPARYIECMQFMMAPTPVAGGTANAALGADVVSNSWSCPTSEGCNADTLQTAVDNLVQAGVFYAAAAQNSGPACSTITDPPALYDSAFVIGATNMSDQLASFSSLGPVVGSTKIRPDVVAPGVNVCSSIPINSYSCAFSGTSMATPHVAGAAALLMSAFPSFIGKPASVASLLRDTAVRQGVTDPSNTSCGGIPKTTFPNYILGYGRIDVFAAYSEEIFPDGFDR